MSLLQNLNKKSVTIAATALAVLVGGVGVAFALSALPSSKNDSPTTTVVGIPPQDLTNPNNSTVVSTVAPNVATPASSTIAGNPMTTTSIGAPSAASIGGSVAVGGDDYEDGEDEGSEDEGGEDEGGEHEGGEHEGDDDGDDD